MSDILPKLKEQMRKEFELVRERFQHTGNKGASVEAVVRDFIRSYLPRRYDVGQGEIIDPYGHRSAQTDIVIINDAHPFIVSAEGPSLFFVDGVFAAGEVKSILTTEELNKSIANALRLRELRCTIPKGSMTFGNKSDLERFTSSPPLFLFAFETQLAKGTVRDRLIAHGNRSFDAVFFLDKGTLLDCGDGQGVLQIAAPNGVMAKGWTEATDMDALSGLLLWLSSMPLIRHGTSILPYYLLSANAVRV